jgi:GntR family transcriptional regulator
MRILLDLHGGVPAYRQIVDQIRFLIIAGELAPGSALPSTRGVGQALGINPMTVSKAYGLLESDGLVEHRPGLALTVKAQPPALLAAAREAELRARLRPAAQAARRLGVPPDDAERAFGALLRTPDPEESQP